MSKIAIKSMIYVSPRLLVRVRTAPPSVRKRQKTITCLTLDFYKKTLNLALFFSSFWEAQCAANPYFYNTKLTFSCFEKVLILVSFLETKSHLQTSKYLDSSHISIDYSIKENENITFVVIQCFVRVSVFHIFIFFIIFS